MLSTVVCVHNEGAELLATVQSLEQGVLGEAEVVVVDDASTDGVCERLQGRSVRVIRNAKRLGVAPSRDLAVQHSRGDVLAFLDGHQRVSTGALNRCAVLAQQRSAIVMPDIRGFGRHAANSHGARFQLCPDNGFFSAHWEQRVPRHRVTRVSSLKAPAYVMPRDVYDQVRWIRGLRNWGGSEAAISLKAFFLDIPILHLCGTPTRHQFKQKLHYDASWDDVWRNHALIARVCFTDRSWFEYWLPRVFDAHLTEDARLDLQSESILDQQREFNRVKQRSDTEFWTDLLQQSLPPELA